MIPGRFKNRGKSANISEQELIGLTLSLRKLLNILLVNSEVQGLNDVLTLLAKFYCEVNMWSGLMIPEILVQREPLPELIILNLSSSPYAALRFVEVIRRSDKGRNIPVLILAQSDLEPQVAEIFDLGPHIYLVKPLTEAKLAEALIALDFNVAELRR